MNPTDTPLSRLSSALELFERYLAVDDPPPPAEFLARHADLADLLQPLLEDESGDEPLREAALPEYLGEYRLVRELGRGGMGVVYEAEHSALRRRVALKVLPASIVPRAGVIARFRREAAVVADIHHPGLVPVFGVGEADGHHYFAMELVEGRGLDRVLPELRRESPERVRRIAELVRRCAEALGAAHARGVVHRDIKPSNILVDAAGLPRIVDFGLARSESMPGLTQPDDLLGTPEYMAPEQIEGRDVDARADVFALGVVLYEMLVCQRPFDGPTRHAVFAAICAQEPIPPRRIARDVPRDLETICLTALAKDPDRRYSDARSLERDLGAFLAHSAIAARPPTWLQRFTRLVRRNPAGTVAALALGLLLVGVPLGFVIVGAAHVAELESRQELLEEQRATSQRNLARAQSALRAQLGVLLRALQDPDLESVYDDIATAVLAQGEALSQGADERVAVAADLVDVRLAVAQLLLRKGALQAALPHVEFALEVAPAGDSVRRAELLSLRSKARFALGELDAARADAALAFDGWRRARDAGDTSDEDRSAFVHALSQTAEIEVRMGEHQRALALADEAQRVWDSLPAAAAAAPRALAAQLSLLQVRIDLEQARGDFDAAARALEVHEAVLARYVVIQPNNPIGELSRIDAVRDRAALARRANDGARHAELVEQAVALARAFCARQPAASSNAELLAACLTDLGGMRFQSGDPVGAVAAVREAIAMLEPFAAQSVPSLSLLDQLARSSLALTAGLLRVPDATEDEREAAFAVAREHARNLVAARPAEPRFRIGLAACLLNVIEWETSRGRQDAAMQAADEALRVLPAAASGEPASQRRLRSQARIARLVLALEANDRVVIGELVAALVAAAEATPLERLADAGAIAESLEMLARFDDGVALQLARHGASQVAMAVAAEPRLAGRAQRLAILERFIARPR